MKWVIIDEDESPLYWCEGNDNENVGSIMEFDTEEDALIFLAAAAITQVLFQYKMEII